MLIMLMMMMLKMTVLNDDDDADDDDDDAEDDDDDGSDEVHEIDNCIQKIWKKGLMVLLWPAGRKPSEDDLGILEESDGDGDVPQSVFRRPEPQQFSHTYLIGSTSFFGIPFH